MSLRTLSERERDRELKAAIQNGFSLLTDEDITLISSELSNSTPEAATAMIIEIIGPERTRVAALLPGIWAPATLADADVAAKVLTAVAAMRDKPAPSKEDIKKTLDALQLTAEERRTATIDIEKTVVGALDWAIIGRGIADITLALLARKLPMLKYATNIPFVARAIGTIGGAAYGAERALPPMPPGPER